jgi:hypothetical protein
MNNIMIHSLNDKLIRFKISMINTVRFSWLGNRGKFGMLTGTYSFYKYLISVIPVSFFAPFI